MVHGLPGGNYNFWSDSYDAIIVCVIKDGVEVFSILDEWELSNPFWVGCSLEETMSTSNFFSSKFKLHPNPVTNQLYIESQEAFQRVEVFTITGKRILEADYQENQPMDVSSLPSGLYMLKIETENGSVTKKLVKR